MLYQCIGISGAILLFYGLLTSALTNITQDWFVRSLWILGFAGLLVFVVKSLERIWQKLLLLFVAVNATWVVYSLGQTWSWYVVIPILLVSAALYLAVVAFEIDVLSIIVVVITLLLGGLQVLIPESAYASTFGLLAALILNVVAFLSAKKILSKEQKDDHEFSKTTLRYVYGVIMFAILVVINILSQDFHHQWDFTSNQINTLSEQSKVVIEKLQEPAQVQIFMKEANQLHAAAQKIASFYENETDQIKFDIIDPDVEKLLSERLEAQDGDVIVSYQGKTYKTQNLSEEGITQGLVKVTADASLMLCFWMGHGELDLDAAQEQERSLSLMKKGLDNEGYSYKKITGITDRIDDRCNVVIIAGPQQSYADNESQALNRYLEAGGNLVALLDPMFTNPNLGQQTIGLRSTGLESVLFKWGVELGRNLILQRTVEMFQGEQIVSKITGFQYGNHPIVDPLKGKQTVFDGVQSVHARPDYEGTTYRLIDSFGQGATWTKSDMQDLVVNQNGAPGKGDLVGPVSFAVATEKEGKDKTQVVVFGDADFISNGVIIGNEFNFDLFLNVLGWMGNQEQKISIRPKMFKTSAIELSESQSKTIFYVAVVLIPMLVLLFGLNLWWIRRQRG